MADNRMLSDEIFRIQGELKSLRPGTEEYKNALEELKMLQSIENEDSRMQIDARKIENERTKIEYENDKAQRDDKREYVKLGASILGGGGLIMLVQLLESEKVIRSKAWQFATKIVNKVL